MKKIISLVCCALCAMYISAQGVDEVTLVVYGDGVNKEEATHVALRNAIEQAYGTFVSANTTILNDSVVKDEIITISSGNIQRYEEISCSQLGNGKTEVTLKATVSVNKLVKYAQSKGAECEFAGATFAANVKLYNLYRANVKKVVENLLLRIGRMDHLFDYELKMNEQPGVSSDGTRFGVDCKICVYSNANTINMIEDIGNTIKAIGLTEGQAQTFIAMGYRLHKRSVRSATVYGMSDDGRCNIDVSQGEDLYFPYSSVRLAYNIYTYRKVPVSMAKYDWYRQDATDGQYDILSYVRDSLKQILYEKFDSICITNNIGSVYPINFHSKYGTRKGLRPIIWSSDDRYDFSCKLSDEKEDFSLGLFVGIKDYVLGRSYLGGLNNTIILTHLKRTIRLYEYDTHVGGSIEELMKISKFWLINSDGSSVSTPNWNDERAPMSAKSSKNVKRTEQSSSNKKVVTKDTQAKESVPDLNQQANVEIVIPQITTNNIIDKMGDTPITSDTVYTLGEIGAKDNLSASIAFLLNEEYEDVSFDVSINSAVYEKMVSLHSVNQQNSKDTDKYFDISYRRVRLPRYDKTCDMLYLKIEGREGLKAMSELPKNISIPLTVQYRYSRRNITSKTIWIQCIVK